MPRILAITGGVGGAKLALGLSRLLGPDELAFAVNTGDDFEHLGFEICPDLDTLTYTLAGVANPDTGWGRVGDSWDFLDALGELGGETWFRLGDKDLAVHVRRTRMLQDGATRTEVANTIAHALGVRHRILPMSDQPVRTYVHTADGPLAFQHYFVRDRCAPAVTGFEFRGADQAKPNPAILEWLDGADGVVICPSNPFVSVDPMLSIPGFREALQRAPARVVAVSPIIGGAALKGPAAKMMQELDLPASADQVAAHYGRLLDGFVLDEQDRDLAGRIRVATVVTRTVMVTLRDRMDLAETVLQFIERLP
ncbi:MAG TPA: 2-phospho-L-lactate transferase [Pseudomonadales bacterium]